MPEDKPVYPPSCIPQKPLGRICKATEDDFVILLDCLGEVCVGVVGIMTIRLRTARPHSNLNSVLVTTYNPRYFRGQTNLNGEIQKWHP